MEWYYYLIAIIGGLVAGIINTLAGNGSAITLTILTEILQLPPNVANGSNRLGIVAQTGMSSYVFYKNDKLHPRASARYIVPTFLGAMAGVALAVWVSNEQFKQVFKFMIVAMLLVVLVKPKRWLQETQVENRISDWIVIPIFFIVGLYGGFIQMGMGIFFLAAMVLGAKFSIIESNAVKSFVVFLYTLVIILVFQWKGLIDWKMGSLIAVGQLAGGWITAVFASKYETANVWAYRLLVVIIILAVLKIFNFHHYLL